MTDEDQLIEAYVAGFCSSRFRGEANSAEKVSPITRRTAEDKARRWMEYYNNE